MDIKPIDCKEYNSYNYFIHMPTFLSSDFLDSVKRALCETDINLNVCNFVQNTDASLSNDEMNARILHRALRELIDIRENKTVPPAEQFNNIEIETNPGIYNKDGSLYKTWTDLIEDKEVLVDANDVLLQVPQNNDGILVVPNSINVIANRVISFVDFSEIILFSDIDLEKFPNPKQLCLESVSNCKNLRRLSIAGNIRSIHLGAIANCPQLEEIHIGANIKYIDDYVVKGFHKLSKLSVDPANYRYSSYNDSNSIIDTKTKCLILGSSKSKLLDSFNIFYVNPGAFAYNTELTNVNLPNTVRHLRCAAFRSCTGLVEFIIPDSIFKLETCVFQDCINLERLVIGSRVDVIKNVGNNSGILVGCPKLDYVEFKGVNYIRAHVGEINEEAQDSDYVWDKVDVSDPHKNAIHFVTNDTNWNNLEMHELQKARGIISVNRNVVSLEGCEGFTTFQFRVLADECKCYNIGAIPDDLNQFAGKEITLLCKLTGDDQHDDAVITTKAKIFKVIPKLESILDQLPITKRSCQ